MTNGIFPDKLKIAKVVPIHKSDDETMFNNYRPISILPTLCKVFEKVIFNQVHENFHVNNLYFSNQYGFRKKHSTEIAVLEVIYRITYQLDQGTGVPRHNSHKHISRSMKQATMKQAQV